jgi:hypothetical protein
VGAGDTQHHSDDQIQHIEHTLSDQTALQDQIGTEHPQLHKSKDLKELPGNPMVVAFDLPCVVNGALGNEDRGGKENQDWPGYRVEESHETPVLYR